MDSRDRRATRDFKDLRAHPVSLGRRERLDTLGLLEQQGSRVAKELRVRLVRSVSRGLEVQTDNVGPPECRAHLAHRAHLGHVAIQVHREIPERMEEQVRLSFINSFIFILVISNG